MFYTKNFETEATSKKIKKDERKNSERTIRIGNERQECKDTYWKNQAEILKIQTKQQKLSKTLKNSFKEINVVFYGLPTNMTKYWKI